MAERARSIVPTRGERPPLHPRRARLDEAVDEFVEFIENLIETMESERPEDADLEPTQPMDYLSDDTPVLPIRRLPLPRIEKARTRPPPPPPISIVEDAEDLRFESDVELLVDTEEMEA